MPISGILPSPPSNINDKTLPYLEHISMFATCLGCCLLELSVAAFSPTSGDPRGPDNDCQVPLKCSDNSKPRGLRLKSFQSCFF